MMILWVCVRAHLAVLDALGMDKALINVEVCVCSGPDGCLRVKVQSRCLFHFSFAGSLCLALYDECESCPGQVNSKQLWSAACTACSVSVIHSFISLQQSPPLRSTRVLILTHFSISLALSLSLYLSPLPFLRSLSVSLPHVRSHLSLPDSLCPHISISHCLPLHPFSSLSTSHSTGIRVSVGAGTATGSAGFLVCRED